MIRKKVLLVDDVELFLELEKSFLKREGFELLVARDGRQAFDIIRDQRPDLVLMDLYMAGMDGDECCRLVKADPALRSIPVVMVTFGGREAEIARCRDAGCDDIVLKPINRQQLLETARKHLVVEERNAPRIETRLRIQYGGAPQQTLSIYAVNLSTGGVFVETREILPPGFPLTLEFDLPGQDRAIRCRGRVAWVNPSGMPLSPRLPAGMGIQFLDLTLSELNALRDYIRSLGSSRTA